MDVKLRADANKAEFPDTEFDEVVLIVTYEPFFPSDRKTPTDLWQVSSDDDSW